MKTIFHMDGKSKRTKKTMETINIGQKRIASRRSRSLILYLSGSSGISSLALPDGGDSLDDFGLDISEVLLPTPAIANTCLGGGIVVAIVVTKSFGDSEMKHNAFR